MSKQERKFTRRQFMGTTLAATAGLSLIGPSLMAATPKRGGILRAGMVNIMHSPDPHRNGGGRFMAMGPIVWEGLLDSPSKAEILAHSRGLTDKKPAFKPMLAESWQVENGGKRYVFQLKKGVKFHDGKELDSADVKWSWERIKEPKHGALNRQLVTTYLDSIDTPDKYTVVANLRYPYAAFLTAAAWEGSVILPKDSIPWGVQWGRTQGFVPPAPAPPGTGPFKITFWQEKHEARMEAFKDYRIEGLPYLDGIVFKVIGKAGPRTMALRAGNIHYAESVESRWLQGIVKQNKAKLFKTFTLEKEGISLNLQLEEFLKCIFLNSHDKSDSPFKDIRVRKAFALTIDQVQLTRVLFGDLGNPNVSSYHPDVSIWGIKDLELPKPDIEKAKQLLKEAGYPKGLDLELNISLIHNNFEQMGQIVQQMAGAAGFRLTLRPGKGSAYHDTFRKNPPTYDLHSHHLGKPDPLFQWFRYLKGQKRLDGYALGSGVKDEVLNKYLDGVALGATVDERVAAYRKAIERVIFEKNYIIPLYNEANAVAWSTKVKNMDPMRYSFPGGCFKEVWLEG